MTSDFILNSDNSSNANYYVIQGWCDYLAKLLHNNDRDVSVAKENYRSFSYENVSNTHSHEGYKENTWIYMHRILCISLQSAQPQYVEATQVIITFQQYKLSYQCKKKLSLRCQWALDVSHNNMALCLIMKIRKYII